MSVTTITVVSIVGDGITDISIAENAVVVAIVHLPRMEEINPQSKAQNNP